MNILQNLKTFAIRPSKAPDLLVAPVEYSQSYQDQLINALRQYFAVVDNFTQGATAVFNTAYRPVRQVTTSYVISPYDSVILVASSAAIQITLPPGANVGNVITVKDAKGNFATFNCTVIGTIDNATNYVMNTNYQYRTFIYNGLTWDIIG